MRMKKIKEELYQNCKNILADKLITVNQIISSNQNALLSETKSSAGDKHETGRAMLQLEMEKASQQYEVIHKMQSVLQKISSINKTDLISLGSLVYTNFQNYYLSISVGEVVVKGQSYYCISTLSPIGKILIGKKEGDILDFNAKTITILRVF